MPARPELQTFEKRAFCPDSRTRVTPITPFRIGQGLGDGLQLIENMERETGIEPVTSSLGTCSSIDNKELRRPWTTILIICTHGRHRFSEKALLNELK
jgi:hypothetical protein